MKALVYNNFTKSQVGALHECIDLCRNGYVQVFEYYGIEWWCLKFRHLTNKRYLVVHIYLDKYIIKEGRNILKEVKY